MGYSILCVFLSYLSLYIYKELLENQLYNKSVWDFNVFFFAGRVWLAGFLLAFVERILEII